MLYPFTIFLVLIFCHSSQAQDDKSVFYEQNFANKIFDESTKPLNIETPENKTQIIPPKEKLKEEAGSRPSDFTELNNSKDHQSEIPGEAVQWIGLIITSNQGSVTQNALRLLQKIARRHDFRIGDLYSIGFDQFTPPDPMLLSELGLRGANFHFGVTAPENLPVKTTPAWIIATEKGEILLEGILDPTLFFNEKGQYIGDPNEEPTPLEAKSNEPSSKIDSAKGSNSAKVAIEKAQREISISPATTPLINN